MVEQKKSRITLEELQRRISVSPFHSWLGLTADSIDDNGITLGMTLRPELIGNPRTGAMQGGVLGCLIDSAASFSIIAWTGGSTVTVDYRVDFHRAAMLSADGPTRIRAVGNIVRIGRTLATADSRVIGTDGNLLASGRAVFMNTEPAASKVAK